MQASFEIVLQVFRRRPIDSEQWRKDGARFATLTMTQNVISKFPQPVGNHPFEVNPLLRSVQAYGKSFHLPLLRLAFFLDSPARYGTRREAKHDHQEYGKKDNQPPDPLRIRT